MIARRRSGDVIDGGLALLWRAIKPSNSSPGRAVLLVRDRVRKDESRDRARGRDF
jgi:hypothetical protein